MSKKRLVTPTRKKLRNLKQFVDLSDEEFEEHFQRILEGAKAEDGAELEEQIAEKLSEFGEDYDLSDMKINDRLVLRNLIVSVISLEELEQTFSSLRTKISDSNILLLDRLSSIMTRLRKDISDMQNDLKLTRKLRKEGREETFIAWLDKLKNYAEEFYHEKSLSIFCKNCRRFLASVWLLYPEEENTLSVRCGNCGTELSEALNPLYETHNRNLEDVAIP